MKSIKVLLLTLLLTVGFYLPSCDDGIDCNCPEITGAYFDIKDVSASFCCNASTDWEQYMINMPFDVEYYGMEEQVEPTFQFPALSLMPSAYACSCIFDGINGSMEEVENITFISKFDYDSLHLANDTINDLILFDSHRSSSMALDSFLISDDKGIYYEEFLFGLLAGPESEREVQFEIKLELNTGEKYTVETDKVVIK